MTDLHSNRNFKFKYFYEQFTFKHFYENITVPHLYKDLLKNNIHSKQLGRYINIYQMKILLFSFIKLVYVM